MLCLIEKYSQNWSNDDRKSKQELDFIFEEDGAITVLEVKSGEGGSKVRLALSLFVLLM